MAGVDTVRYPLLVTGGTEVGFVIPSQARGTLKKVIVAQLTGTLAGFTYTLYNKATACPPGVDPTNSATEPEVLYRVLGPVTVASSASYFFGTEQWPNDGVHGVEIPYSNLDNAASNPPGSPLSQLYLKLLVAGIGAKTFGIAMTTEIWQF